MKMAEVSRRWRDGADDWGTTRRNVLEAIAEDSAASLDVFDLPMREEMLREIEHVARSEPVKGGIFIAPGVIDPSLSDVERSEITREKEAKFARDEMRYRDAAREWLRRRDTARR